MLRRKRAAIISAISKKGVKAAFKMLASFVKHIQGVVTVVTPQQKLGPEKIINGNFEDGETSWVLTAGCSIILGELNVVLSAFQNCNQLVDFTGEKVYIVEYTVTNYTSGEIKAKFTGGVETTPTSRTAVGTYTEYITANVGNDRFIVQAGADGFVGSIDNVSVKQVLQDVGDFTFSRASGATRVNSQGLIEEIEILGDELVANGDFEELGVEQITNGDFTTDTVWSKGAGWSISGGTANVNTTGTFSIAQPAGIVLDKKYRVEYTIKNYVSGQIRTVVGGWNVGATNTANGTYTEYIPASDPSTDANMYFQTLSGAVLSIDDISVVEVLEEGIPRIDYTDGTPVLLTEPQSTNLVLNSEPIANEGVTSDVTYEVYNWGNGLTNCTRFLDNTTDRYRYCGTSAIGYTMSFYIEMDDGSEPQIGVSSNLYDFHFVLGNDVAININKKNVFNNIWIISGECQSSTVNTSNGVWKKPSHSIKGFRVVGWQIEALPYATSYIPTEGATATRAAETVTDGGDVNTFNSEEGVLFVEISALALDNTNKWITISDGTTLNYVQLRYTDTSGNIALVIKVGGIIQAVFGSTLLDINNHKVAIKWKINDFSLWVDGVEVGTDTSGVSFPINTLNRLSFNEGDASGNEYYGKTKQIQVFKTALTDKELIRLTS